MFCQGDPHVCRAVEEKPRDGYFPLGTHQYSKPQSTSLPLCFQNGAKQLLI